MEAGNVASGSKPATMDRCLGEFIRILDKRVPGDHSVVHAYGGLPLLTRIIQLTSVSITSTSSSAAAVALSRWVTLNSTLKFIFSDMSDSTSVCNRSASLACDAVKSACRSYWEGCHYLLYTNRISALVDLITAQLQLLQQNTGDGDASSVKGQSQSSAQRSLRMSQTSSAIAALSTIFSSLATLAPSPLPTDKGKGQLDGLTSRLQDVVR